MQIEKMKENVHVFNDSHVQLKTMGNIYEVRCIDRKSVV